MVRYADFLPAYDPAARRAVQQPVFNAVSIFMNKLCTFCEAYMNESYGFDK
jgi:hypothetical protein